jgi:hypothetical protein
MPYRYVVDQAADEVIATLAGRDQRGLRVFFRFLSEHPFTRGDEEVGDNEGRLSQTKMHGRFVVTYRPDHAVQQLHIVAIEFL